MSRRDPPTCVVLPVRVNAPAPTLLRSPSEQQVRRLVPTHMVPALSATQLQQFVEEGFLVLPAALDPTLCAQARDFMWNVLNKHVGSRLQRDDPRSWGSFDPTENQASEPTPYEQFSRYNDHQFHVRCGAEEVFLDLFPRALWTVCEQLLGAGTVVWPAGIGEDGLCTGPVFVDNAQEENMNFVLSGRPPMCTRAVAIQPTGPVWINGQGSRGIYAILPEHNAEGDFWRSQLQGEEGLPFDPRNAPRFGGVHSDLAVLDERPIHAMNRIRLRATCYIDDCPTGSGGLHVWPRSHTRVWKLWQQCLDKAGEFHPHRNPAVAEATRLTAPVECAGPAGTVVVWAETLLHTQGVNRTRACTTDAVIRQAVHHDVHKTVESVPDELLKAGAQRSQWADWSDAVQAVAKRCKL